MPDSRAMGTEGVPMPADRPGPEGGRKHPQTWRDKIREAADAVDAAYVFRAKVFADAIEAGFSYRQVAEAAEMSAQGVHKIVGGPTLRAEGPSLDDKAPS